MFKQFGLKKARFFSVLIVLMLISSNVFGQSNKISNKSQLIQKDNSVVKNKILTSIKIATIGEDYSIKEFDRDTEIDVGTNVVTTPGKKIAIKEIEQVDTNTKLRVILEKLILGITIDEEKSKGSKSFINPKTKLVKCNVIPRKQYPDEYKIELDFSEELIENFSIPLIENIGEQIAWTIRENGFTEIIEFDFKINGKDVTYYVDQFEKQEMKKGIKK